MEAQARNCHHCKKEFQITGEDFGFYEKMGVPAPVECPQCRQQRRIHFRNFKTLYKRPSSKSGKSLISMYSTKAPFPVWGTDEWWADDWDAKGFACDIDFTKPIFPQIKALMDVVPHYAVMNTNSPNCQYSNMVVGSKNCYLIFGCFDSEDCMYGHLNWVSNGCVDCLYIFKSELCYECIDVIGSFNLKYCQECEDCTDSIGLFDCKSCVSCIGCVGLRGKSYCVFNEQVSKEQYQQFLKDHPITDPATIKMILEKRDELRHTVPQRHFYGSHNTNVSGNHIYNANNVQYSFDVKGGGENSKYLFTILKALDSMDISFSTEVELCYMDLLCTGQRIFFSQQVVHSADVYYSANCYTSRNLFACEGLKGAEYCIFNKQYTKEEYEQLVPKLIAHMKSTGEWGQFMPNIYSPFAYNESIVNEYYPMTKEQALAAGFRWEDDILGPQAAATSPEIVNCDRCKRNYRLTPQETELYKKMGVVAPAKCFNCRHEARMKARNTRNLWSGACAKCSAPFETSYNPNQQKEFKIYCEKCYLEAMV